MECVDSGNRRWVSDPLQCLPVVDQPDVVHLIDGVQELDEALLVMGLREPGGVVEETERSAGLRKVLLIFESPDTLYMYSLDCIL